MKIWLATGVKTNTVFFGRVGISRNLLLKLGKDGEIVSLNLFSASRKMEVAPLATQVSLSLSTTGATPCSKTSITSRTCIWDATTLEIQRWWKTWRSTTQTLKLFLFLTDMMRRLHLGALRAPYGHNVVVVGCCCCWFFFSCLDFFTADECMPLISSHAPFQKINLVFSPILMYRF